MFALRTFDQSYAPKTIPKARRDPGRFLIEKAEHATRLSRVLPGGTIRKRAEGAGALVLQVAYGVAPGILYVVLCGRHRGRSPLSRGIAIGVAVYLLGYLGWLPLAGLTRPIWKQPLPELAGETMRHVAYGVTTAVVYDAISAAAGV